MKRLSESSLSAYRFIKMRIRVTWMGGEEEYNKILDSIIEENRNYELKLMTGNNDRILLSLLKGVDFHFKVQYVSSPEPSPSTDGSRE